MADKWAEEGGGGHGGGSEKVGDEALGDLDQISSLEEIRSALLQARTASANVLSPN